MAFRGSRAVAAGLVTPDRLRGPRFQRLLPDVYGASLPGYRPALLLRSLAAYRLVEGHGVLSRRTPPPQCSTQPVHPARTPAEVPGRGAGARGVATDALLPAATQVGTAVGCARRSRSTRGDRGWMSPS